MNCKVVSLVFLCALLKLAAAETAAEVVIHPENTTGVDAGSTVLFVCVSYGDPVPTIIWRGNGQTLGNNSKVMVYEELLSKSNITFVKSTLQICDVEASDVGVYSCSAENLLGSDTVSFEISVNTVQLLLYPEDTEVNSSSGVILPCVGHGIPLPVITWSIAGGEILRNSSRVTIYERIVPSNRSGGDNVVQSLLVFCGDSTSTNDHELQSGQYSCRAVSGNATDTAKFNLTVNNEGEQQGVTDDDKERGSTAITYVGSSVCLLLLLITIITYLSSSSLCSSATGISLLNVSLAMTLLYVCFIVSHHATSSEVLCAVFSSLFHWFFLVSALTLTTAAVFRVCEPKPGRKRWLIFFIIILLNWGVPLGVLIVSLSPNYQNYLSDGFCRPVEQPYWFGLIFPWGIINILTWTVLCVAPCFNLSPIKEDKSWSREHAGFITITLLFDITWGVGLPPTHQIGCASSMALKALFMVSSIFLGAGIFLTFCALSQDVGIKWKSWANQTLCKGAKRFLNRNHNTGMLHIHRPVAQESIYSTIQTRTVLPPSPGESALIIHNPIPVRKVAMEELYEDTVQCSWKAN